MPWKCVGVTSSGNTDRKHPECLVSDRFCPQCGLTEDETKPQKKAAGSASTLLAAGSITAVAVALLGWIGYTVWPNGEAGPPPGMATHKNERYGISMNFPESWELREPSRNYPPDVLSATKDLFQLVLPGDDGTYKENVLVKIEQVTGNELFLDSYADQQVARIDQIDTFEIESDQKDEIDGQPVREIVYAGFDGEHSLRRRRLIAGPSLPGDYFLLITYTADQNDYEKHMPEVDEVFSSIALL